MDLQHYKVPRETRGEQQGPVCMSQVIMCLNNLSINLSELPCDMTMQLGTLDKIKQFLSLSSIIHYIIIRK